MSSVQNGRNNVVKQERRQTFHKDTGGLKQGKQQTESNGLNGARLPRNRLLSDPTDELPKGILKRTKRVPTKRSFSECIDNVTNLMEAFGLDYDDVLQNLCPIHGLSNFDDDLIVEIGGVRDVEDAEIRSLSSSCEVLVQGEPGTNKHEWTNQSGDAIYSDTRKSINKKSEATSGDNENYLDGCIEEIDTIKTLANRGLKIKKKCECELGDGNHEFEKPKKTVRFDDRVYQAYYHASRLYDRRNIRYHLSTRHHPPPDKKNKKSASKRNRKGSSDSDDVTDQQDCQQTRSQRARQSKKDKKKRFNRKGEITGTNCDDQGYFSSIHSLSD